MNALFVLIIFILLKNIHVTNVLQNVFHVQKLLITVLNAEKIEKMHLHVVALQITEKLEVNAFTFVI